MVDPADVDESPADGEAASTLVARLSALKASTVASRHDGAVVVAADTVVVVDGEILGKPADAADAALMLERLSGRSHQVITGMTVAADADLVTVTTDTEVAFRPLSTAEIDWYVATGEPFDKAGAYALQGIAACFVTAIDGSPDSVIGLSLAGFVDAVSRVGA